MEKTFKEKFFDLLKDMESENEWLMEEGEDVFCALLLLQKKIETMDGTKLEKEFIEQEFDYLAEQINNIVSQSDNLFYKGKETAELLRENGYETEHYLEE